MINLANSYITNKEIKLFIVYFTVFFVIIFFIWIYFFQKEEKNYLEYIKNEPKIIQEENDDFTNISKVTEVIDLKSSDISKDDKTEVIDKKQKYREILKELKQKVKEKEAKLESEKNVKFIYNPVDFEKDLLHSSLILNLNEIIFWKLFLDKWLKFGLELNKLNYDVRWRYKDKTIKLYDIEKLPKSEIISVFIHELGHFFDIDYFEKKVLYDLSDNFYNISWESSKILKPWQTVNDFISGYAMTNKYEDFAESFINYILYNTNFLEKSKKSKILKQKYNFFEKYLFKNDEFKNTNFSISAKIPDYYWDTTKIEFSLQNFLNYLKK